MKIHTTPSKLINDSFYFNSIQNWNNALNTHHCYNKNFRGSHTRNLLQSSYIPWNQKLIKWLHKQGKIKYLLILLKAPGLLGWARQNQGRRPVESLSPTTPTVSNNRSTHSSAVHHMVNLSIRRFSSTKTISIHIHQETFFEIIQFYIQNNRNFRYLHQKIGIWLKYWLNLKSHQCSFNDFNNILRTTENYVLAPCIFHDIQWKGNIRGHPHHEYFKQPKHKGKLVMFPFPQQ